MKKKILRLLLELVLPNCRRNIKNSTQLLVTQYFFLKKAIAPHLISHLQKLAYLVTWKKCLHGLRHHWWPLLYFLIYCFLSIFSILISSSPCLCLQKIIAKSENQEAPRARPGDWYWHQRRGCASSPSTEVMEGVNSGPVGCC